MKCDKCDNPATTHLIEIKDGTSTQLQLCAECAALIDGMPTAAQLFETARIVGRFNVSDGKLDLKMEQM